MTPQHPHPPVDSELQRRAQERLRECQEPQPLETAGSATAHETMRLVSELQIHQIELELQNEELQQARAHAETLMAEYADLYEFAPTGYLTLDRNGIILRINLNGSRLLGVARSRLVNHPFVQFVAEYDQRVVSGFFDRVFAEEPHPNCEVVLLRKDAPPLVVEMSGVRSTDGQECRVALSDITQRRQAEDRLGVAQAETARLLELSDQSLRQKDWMLKEIHHRVNNNLQIISSLLRLQAGQIESTEAQVALQDMQNRVRSMALIHEHLYRSDNLTEVDLAAYIKKLCQQLFRALVAAPEAIHLHLDLMPVSLAIDQAVPCGLLVNELVSNALKHAFPDGRAGEVRVELHAHPAGPGWRLRVADNGVGLPPDLAPDHLTTSLGMNLCVELTRQMGARLEIGGGPGSEFVIEWSSCG